MLVLRSVSEYKPHLSTKLITCIMAILVAASLILAGCASSNAPSQATDNSLTNLAVEEEPLVDNPINFAELIEQNSDIYAWLFVPEMDINCPLFQSGFEDIDFYLWRDINKNPSGVGEAYTQPFNSKDFSDPVTLIYGHSIQGTTVAFTNLHRLEDPATFAANEYFYVITPDKILTYQIITIQEVSDEHILLNDFETAEGQQAYFDELMNPTVPGSLVRENVTLVGGESKLVHLVTCPVPSKSGARVIIGGLLVEEQKTKLPEGW